jgi:hypothetical protein
MVPGSSRCRDNRDGASDRLERTIWITIVVPMLRCDDFFFRTLIPLLRESVPAKIL